MQQVTPEMVREWVENPLTEALQERVNAFIEDFGGETPVFYRGDPQRTHDAILELQARAAEWEVFRDILAGDWSVFDLLVDEEDEDEQFGDLPEG